VNDFNWIKKTIASCYGLEVTKVVQVRAVWRVETSAGSKCFKRVKEFRGKINFVASAVQYLIDNGFDATIPFLKTNSASYVAVLPEGVFYLTDWIPGREADLTNPEDLRAAGRVLAKLHKASHGFSLPLGLKARETWGNLPFEWGLHLQKLSQYSTLAQQDPQDSFNLLYAEWYENYRQRCIQALSILKECDYKGLVQRAKEHGTICHKDFTYHNLIVDQADCMRVIDFDYCAQEIPAYDLGRLIRIVGKSTDWQIDYIRLVLQAYHLESPLTPEEMTFILAFLHFPQRLWRIVNRHFSGKPEKSERATIDHLQNEINNFRPEENMLKLFTAEISRGSLVGR